MKELKTVEWKRVLVFVKTLSSLLSQFALTDQPLKVDLCLTNNIIESKQDIMQHRPFQKEQQPNNRQKAKPTTGKHSLAELITMLMLTVNHNMFTVTKIYLHCRASRKQGLLRVSSTPPLKYFIQKWTFWFSHLSSTPLLDLICFILSFKRNHAPL